MHECTMHNAVKIKIITTTILDNENTHRLSAICVFSNDVLIMTMHTCACMYVHVHLHK